MTRLPSGTVTLVFSDIEGSTRLLRQLGSAYASVLEEHRSLIRGAFTAAGGEEVETRGDSFLFAFASARRAVDGAVAAQRALASHAWPKGAAVRVRMGLHTGEPQLAAEGYVGLDVHRAARIGDAGNGGQIVVSEATRALVGDVVVLRDLGDYRLGGLEAPERLYDVLIDGLPSGLGRLRAQRLRRSHRHLRATDVGWRIHTLGSLAPPGLARPIEALAGSVLAAARIADEAGRAVETVDRTALAALVEDHRRRAGVAAHVARAADELESQLTALDRLPERRQALDDAVSALGGRLDDLEARLRAGPPAAVADELEYERTRLAAVAASLEETIAAAPSPPQVPLGRLRRTRRRGIYRVGEAFVVLEPDEHGAKQPRPASSLYDAIAIRDALRAARRGPHRGYVGKPVWEDKSSGGSGPG